MNAATKTYCIIGDPVGHTLSPVMHNAAFRALNINAVYTAFAVRESALENAVRGVRALGIAGASVTIPHKEEIIRYLDDVTDAARRIGAVNTLFWKDGRLTGDNTDAAGFHDALAAKIRTRKKTVALFGSGGVARAALFSLANLDKFGTIYILSRNSEKAKLMMQEADKPETGLDIRTFSLSSWKDVMHETDVIVNATPVGMTPDARSSILKSEEIPEGITVMDLVYRPHRTALLANALARGCEVVYGLDMLLYQGAEQFRLWTGKKAPLDVMKRALQKALKG